ncbi:hypothetical protein AB0N05_22025 [Nocardia sp. NPDC051030]|uniref:hypothetical protein n=1 Tax=Nocardia sp. NPDC051030 TaxID=3155162 RepID=UPI00341A54A7
MLYDPKTMNELAASLKENFGQLKVIAGDGDPNSSSDLHDATQQLTQAWTNEHTGDANSALTSFNAVKAKWDAEYKDTLHTLNAVASEVENALGRALGADQKIGDGFGGV